MTKKHITWIVVLILLASILFATDSNGQNDTPYRLGAIGSNRGTQSVTFIVNHIDLLTHYRNVGAVVYDSILDTAEYLGTNTLAGFYGSSQEIHMLLFDTLTTYNDRVVDTTRFWLYILATEYLEDTLGVSVDSLCLAWLDTAWCTVNDGRGDQRTRFVNDTIGLAYHQKWYSYQRFDNGVTSPPDYKYPAGYSWLANGANTDVREAIAYAFRRRVYDPVIRDVVDGVDIRSMNYIYMDNQYMSFPFLGSYNSTCDSLVWYGTDYSCWPDTFICSVDTITTGPLVVEYTCDSVVYWPYTGDGGPTTGIDLTGGNEDIDIEVAFDSYFQGSTALIDSVLKSKLDSVAGAGGYDSVETVANVSWSDSLGALYLSPYVSGVMFEGPLQPDRGAGLWAAQWKISAGFILDQKTTIGLYYQFGDFSAYFDEGEDRGRMAHYCFFLNIQNFNVDDSTFYTVWLGSNYLDWTGEMRDLYKFDLGYPIDTAMNAHYSGGTWSGANAYRWVKKRYYVNSGAADTTAVVLFGSTSGSDWDHNLDSIEINLADGAGKLWSELDLNGDTLATIDSIFYVKPYEGKILVPRGQGVRLTNKTNDTLTVNVLESIIFGLTSEDKICTLQVWFNDSLLLDQNWSGVCKLPSEVNLTDTSIEYTPICADAGSGSYYRVRTVNELMSISDDTVLVVVEVAGSILPTITTVPSVIEVNGATVDTVEYTLVGTDTFVSDVCSLSIDGGATYSFEIDSHPSIPLTGDTLAIWTPTESATGVNCVIKLCVTSTDVTCSDVIFCIESNTFEYLWVDTTIFIIGSSDTTGNSSYWAHGNGSQAWTPWAVPTVSAGVLYLDSAETIANPNYTLPDTILIAVRYSAGALPGDLIGISDSGITNTTNTIPGLISVAFGEGLTFDDTCTVLWLGSFALPAYNAIATLYTVRVLMSDTLGVTSYYIMGSSLPLPTAWPGATGSDGSLDMHLKVFSHIEAPTSPTSPMTLEQSVTVIKKKKGN